MNLDLSKVYDSHEWSTIDRLKRDNIAFMSNVTVEMNSIYFKDSGPIGLS